MSGDKFDRRDFFRRAGAVTAGAAGVFSFEEHALLAAQFPNASLPPAEVVPGPMPTGTLGGVPVSRLIAGHNLVAGTAHARDLIYVSQLLTAYFTDDKILETYRKYEDYGVNTAFLRIEKRQLGLAKRYRLERGGKLQWMAQCVINEKDQTRDLDMAMELPGVRFAYVRGLEGDKFFKSGRLDVIASAVEYMKKHGIVAGVASHSLDALMAVEAAKIPADFYVKTFNSAQYWSAGAPAPRDPNWKPSPTELVQSEYGPAAHDNLWETTPKQTAEFFHTIDKPFVAYKVLAAGAIHPRDGFDYAFRNGADFVSVGMYDFQVAEDVGITKKLLNGAFERPRPWRT
jgi:hypothetical protein